MYRPTVRYDAAYKSYIDDLFRATTLDRNQLIRLALFTAAHSEDYLRILNRYKKKDVSLPSPAWSADQHGYWTEQTYSAIEGSEDVNGRTDEGRKGTVCLNETIRFTDVGGIRITLG